MTDGTLTLIVAKPGRKRDGLHAVLAAMPGIAGVREVSDGPSALNAVAEYRPALVFLDFDLSEDVATLLTRFTSEYQRAQCIAIVYSVQQRRDAVAAGADHVLMSGFSAARLRATIRRLGV